MNTKCISTEET